MLCRIECRRENERLTVFLAGRLSAAQVPEFLTVCAEMPHPTVVLDELVSTDAVGLDALMRVEEQGARLVGLPEYLRLTLDTIIRERQP